MHALGTEVERLREQQLQQEQQRQLVVMTLQAEMTSLRQEIDMTRLQREHQRSWNKNVLKEQSVRFDEEMDVLREQLRGQKKQQEEMKELRAELSELKASLHEASTKVHRQFPGGTKLDAPPKYSRAQGMNPASPDDEEKLHAEFDAAKQEKDRGRVERSISALQARWQHFLCNQNNYMFASNFDNGLTDILVQIRDFSVAHVHATAQTLDLVMQAMHSLHRFTTLKADEGQDCLSVPKKVACWLPFDAFAALLLRGLGWKYEDSERSLRQVQQAEEYLRSEMDRRMLEHSLGPWFPDTTAGLEKCIKRLASTSSA